MRLFFGITGIILSFALACVSFIFCGSPKEEVFYTGIGFGLAAILVFMASVNGLKKGGKKNPPPADNGEKTEDGKA